MSLFDFSHYFCPPFLRCVHISHILYLLLSRSPGLFSADTTWVCSASILNTSPVLCANTTTPYVVWTGVVLDHVGDRERGSCPVWVQNVWGGKATVCHTAAFFLFPLRFINIVVAFIFYLFISDTIVPRGKSSTIFPEENILIFFHIHMQTRHQQCIQQVCRCSVCCLHFFLS